MHSTPTMHSARRRLCYQVYNDYKLFFNLTGTPVLIALLLPRALPARCATIRCCRGDVARPSLCATTARRRACTPRRPCTQHAGDCVTKYIMIINYFSTLRGPPFLLLFSYPARSPPAVPPFAAAVVTLRVQVCVPPPHV